MNDKEQFINQFGAIRSMAEGRRLLNAGIIKVDGTDISKIPIEEIEEGQVISFGKHKQFEIRNDHL